jgi:lysyl-tRNA synthetase class 2
MKPESPPKAPAMSKAEEYTALGVPAEWVEPLQKLGYTTVDKLKEVEKPGKLHQEMMGYRKKNKLEIGSVTLEDVADWLGN